MDENIIDLVMSFYLYEPCRICGKDILPEDLHSIVYAGYSSDNKSRSAHKNCWENRPNKSQWAFPVDSE